MAFEPVEKLVGNNVPLPGTCFAAIGTLAMAAALAAECSRAEPAAETITLALDDAVDVSVAVVSGQREVLLWLAADYEMSLSAEKLAQRLGAPENEVWVADLTAARFLPRVPSSISQVPAADVSQLIEVAHEKTDKPIYLLAADRAAGLALRGAADWQKRHPDGLALGGAILFHPYLYEGPPEAGQDARYLPVVRETKLPIFILQPKLSSGRWWLKRLRDTLEAKGSAVTTLIMPAARDRFFFRPDATYLEDAMTRLLPDLVTMAISTLRGAQGDPP